jgi:hypothetical protein
MGVRCTKVQKNKNIPPRDFTQLIKIIGLDQLRDVVFQNIRIKDLLTKKFNNKVLLSHIISRQEYTKPFERYLLFHIGLNSKRSIPFTQMVLYTPLNISSTQGTPI